MTRSLFPLPVLSGILMLCATMANAASLQVSPTTVSITAPGAASTLTLRNGSDQPLPAQIRVLRWRQHGGESILEPTTDVVVSPPMATIAPKGEYVVRIVRTSRQPLAAEESYRLLVDEIPNANARAGGRVNFALRYSVPVFFSSQNASAPELDWSLERNAGGRRVLVVRNTGGRHVRLSDLQVKGSSSRAMVREGLAGYVLPNSALRFPISSSAGAIVTGQNIRVHAQTEAGPVSGVLHAAGTP